jgi:RNA polymerase sigma factor (sigma-70 family)
MSQFPTTRPSLIAAACAGIDGALDELCALYLAPVRAVVRCFVRGASDAQDLTQNVFADVIQPPVLASAQSRLCRFRDWLRSRIRRIASRERKHARTLKQGGGGIVLSLDLLAAEGRHALEPADRHTPAEAHARRRISELHDRVLAELERRYAARGERDRFHRLLPFIDGRGGSYRAVAESCGQTAGTLRKQVYDLKKCYAAVVHADFRRRGIKPADIDNEIRNLLDELS